MTAIRPIRKTPSLCDNCGQRLAIRGVNEPEFVHFPSGSVFCTDRRATFMGRTSPRADSGG